MESGGLSGASGQPGALTPGLRAWLQLIPGTTTKSRFRKVQLRYLEEPQVELNKMMGGMSKEN